jgi:diguanylate cyclase (GGDEF)-like protein/PAS domain S-box-containing protein
MRERRELTATRGVARPSRWPGRGAGVGVCSLICTLALMVVALALAARPASALKAIDITADTERIDIFPLGEFHAPSDRITLDTVPESDGVSQSWAADASTPGTKPGWFAFALHNTTDKQVERWLVIDRYNPAASGVLLPDLDARRILKVSHSRGYAPEVVKSDRADVIRIILEPGRTVTFAVELASDRIASVQLWGSLEYEQRGRNHYLFSGVMVGITGLLALFLTAVFAANHKAIFPAAAGFAWCVLAYLIVDFGFWHKLFSIRPEENAQYRAATEAALAASLVVFLHVFLRLRASHRYVRILIGIWIAVQCALVALAFLDPRLAATFVRLSSVPIGVVGAGITLYLALRGQDRALALVPTWMLLLVWLFGAAATLLGRLSGDFVILSLIAGLVLIVVLIGFTVTQFAFRSTEPVFGGSQPGDQQLRALAVDGAGAAVWEWNARRDEVKVSPIVEQTLGLKAGELSAKTDAFVAHMHPADRERFKLLLSSMRERGGGELRLEFRMRHVDASYRWFELDAASLPSQDRRNLRCVGLVRDATDTKRAQERLLHNAVYDSLSGLPNRELFLDRLAAAAKRAALEPLIRPSLLFIDIDRFKAASASVDLPAADSLLLTIARRLARNLGPQDTLARVGRDQFALLLLSQTDPRELAMLAEQVRRSVRSPIAVGGREIVLTASVGISTYNGPAESPAALLQNAEIAMYRAKRAGSDRVEMYNPDMRADPDGRLALEGELRAALEKKHLKVVYHPVFYLPTETLAGFKAELRWEHPRLGTLNPAHLVTVAEDSDLVAGLWSYLLTRAARDGQRWQRELPRPDQPVFVAVGVASRQLLRPELVNEMRHVLGRAVMPKGSLRLEIAEWLVMENPEKARALLEQLAAAGNGLSVDEFGTGYSSLSYLSRLAFDTIKVDRAYVQARGHNAGGGSMLRSIVALARELGHKVWAEGVEAEDDIVFLRSIGCEFAQGVYYGELMSDRDVSQLLKDVRRAERRLKRSRLFRTKSGAKPRPETSAPPAALAAPLVPPAPVGVAAAPSAPAPMPWPDGSPAPAARPPAAGRPAVAAAAVAPQPPALHAAPPPIGVAAAGVPASPPGAGQPARPPVGGRAMPPPLPGAVASAAPRPVPSPPPPARPAAAAPAGTRSEAAPQGPPLRAPAAASPGVPSAPGRPSTAPRPPAAPIAPAAPPGAPARPAVGRPPVQPPRMAQRPTAAPAAPPPAQRPQPHPLTQPLPRPMPPPAAPPTAPPVRPAGATPPPAAAPKPPPGTRPQPAALPPRPIVPPPGPLAPLFSASRPNPVAAPLPPHRPSKPGPDLSKLPASIRDSLAKLAGDAEADESKPAAPPPSEGRDR